MIAQFLSQCTHMWLHWLLLGTCEYIDCNIEVNTRLSSKSQCTHMTFTVTYENIELWKGYLLSFVVSYHLFVFFNNANTVSAEMWVWGFGNHVWYKILVKSLVFDSWLETFVSLVISKTPYSHFLLTVFSHYKCKDCFFSIFLIW